MPAIGITKSYIIGGVQEGVEEPIYIGVYPSVDDIPNTTTEGKLIYGDHALVEDSSGNRTPYYYTGTQWVIADGQMPTDLAWKVLMDSLYDATTSPGTLQSQSIINLFAQNFAAFNAFVYNLLVRNLLVGSGTTTSGFRFEVYDYQNGEKVTPVIRAVYNGNVVFQIDPTTGNVFFGQPNSDLTAPSKGFMYRASDQTIRSANGRFVISASGYLSASGASISGSITATSGSINNVSGYNIHIYGDSTFEGTFETSSIKTENAGLSEVTRTITGGDTSIAKKLADALISAGYQQGVWYSAEVSTDSNIASIRITSYSSTSVTIDARNTSNGTAEFNSKPHNLGVQQTAFHAGELYWNSNDQAMYLEDTTTFRVWSGEKLFIYAPMGADAVSERYQVYCTQDGTLKIKLS